MNCGLGIAGTAPGNRRPPSAELSDCRLNTEWRPDDCSLPPRAGAGQLCETNPISDGPGTPQHSSTPLFRHSRPRLIVPNKANFTPGRCRAGTPNLRRAEGAIVPNKPNFGSWPMGPWDRLYKQSQFRTTGGSCETNPIRAGRRGRDPAGQKMRNKPNLQGSAAVRTGPIAQNEPNFRPAGRLGTPDGAKQSQLAEANRVKQSQFPFVRSRGSVRFRSHAGVGGFRFPLAGVGRSGYDGGKTVNREALCSGGE
jgi:hypothetical protein